MHLDKSLYPVYGTHTKFKGSPFTMPISRQIWVCLQLSLSIIDIPVESYQLSYTDKFIMILLNAGTK